MSKRSMSAEELWKLSVMGQVSLPVVGVKEYAPDGSWMQEKSVEMTLRGRCELLQTERAAKQSSLARGLWRPNIGKVQVTKQQGKFWQTMGVCEGGLQLLDPEEALFLMDIGSMEIYYGEVPLSLKQAYATLLGNCMRIEQYQVYAHLTRFGYILQRHAPNVKLTSYEQQIHLDQHLKRNPKGKRKLRKGQHQENKDAENPVVKKQKTEGSDCSSPHNDEREHCTSCNQCESSKSTMEKTEQSNISKHSLTLDKNRSEQHGVQRKACNPLPMELTEGLTDVMQPEANSPPLTAIKPTSSIPYSKWDWTVINFPSVANKKILHIKQPSLDVLPCCVQYARSSFTMDVAKLMHPRRTEPGDHLEFSLGSAGWKGKIVASNWGEYRHQYCQKLGSFTLENSPANCLWNGEVKPLIKPQDASSSADLLQKLQIIKHANLAKQDIRVELPPGQHILYDVYLPNSKFRKTMLQKPSHHLCVVRAEDPFPNLDTIVTLQQECQENVPLLWAVVNCGDISFYILHDVTLPTKITMG